jgi:hypothetical protein
MRQRFANWLVVVISAIVLLSAALVAWLQSMAG